LDASQLAIGPEHPLQVPQDEQLMEPVMAGNGRALVLDFAGTLFLFDVKPGGAKRLGKLKVCDETYAAPALARGRLYVRDEKAVYCYELPDASP
jgi:hypothetical protein